MCLLVIGFGVHPVYDLVVAGNRDERHARPAAALDWWGDAPDVLAGRDLEAGGTWLGVDRRGRFAAVTNFREGQASTPLGPSRGALVAEFLTGRLPAREYLHGLQQRGAAYAGFNLLLADRSSLWYVSNRGSDGARRLAPGIYGLSNDLLDTPWPKLLRSRARLTEWIDRGDTAPQPLFDLLADREPAEWGPAEPTAELARAASAAFIVHASYGTRASTVLTREPASARRPRLSIAERRFAAAGRAAGDSAFAIEIAAEEPAARPEL
jgi:uncharacterized protein with NRDE domain